MDLNYRYSPPAEEHSGSRLTLSINDQFIEAFNLTTEGQGVDSNRVRVPLLDDSFLSSDEQVRIPAFKVGSKTKLILSLALPRLQMGSVWLLKQANNTRL